MSVSIIFLALLFCVSFYGIFASFNRLVRTNIGLVVAFMGTGVIYIFDIVLNNRFIADFIDSLYIRIYPEFLNSVESFAILFYMFLFLLFYLIARLIIHFTLVGTNPTYKPSYLKYLHSFNLIAFLIMLFAIISLVIPYTKEYFNIPFGFMEKFFEAIYGWVI